MIKDTIKKETKELRREGINKLKKIEEIKLIITELKIETRFNELANILGIRSTNISVMKKILK